jgi:hypothetical protein
VSLNKANKPPIASALPFFGVSWRSDGSAGRGRHRCLQLAGGRAEQRYSQVFKGVNEVKILHKEKLLNVSFQHLNS